MEKDKKENPIPDQPTNEVNKVVHTYTEDMVSVIGGHGGSLVKKIIHSEEEQEKERRKLSPETAINRFFMLMSLVLITTGLMTVFFFILAKDDSPVPIGVQFTPLIFNDQTTFLEVRDLNSTQIVHAVLNEADIEKSGVKGVYLSDSKQVVGLRKFISLIGGNLVLESLGSSTNFVSDNFLLGFVGAEALADSPPQIGSLFILIKTRSMADIFESLRSWEGKMFSDLHPFFGLELSSDTKYLLTKDFEGDIVANKNARILYDKGGEIVMMYVFADETSVVVTNTTTATIEIISRLASGQVKR